MIPVINLWMILVRNKFHPKLDVLVINLWMILVWNKFYPKLDVSSHQFMDDSCTE